MGTMNDLIVGLNILGPKAKNKYVAAEHDIIYASEVTTVNLTDEEKKQLKDHSWHIDSEFNCWAFFT